MFSLTLLLLTLMMKVLLLLNFEITLFLCLARLLVKSEKGGQKGQKSYHRSRMGQKGGQTGSRILPKRRSCTKIGSKRRSKRVKDLRDNGQCYPELLMLRGNP